MLQKYIFETKLEKTLSEKEKPLISFSNVEPAHGIIFSNLHLKARLV
jgi:hypothetical protein